MYERHVATLNDQSNSIHSLLQTRVAQSSDIPQLLKEGQSLLNHNQPEIAALYFARVSDLDPNLRDADYAWGYSLAQSNGGHLSGEQTDQVRKAIDRTEKVDPFYVPMLQLKLAIAQSMHDDATISATQARLDLLKK